MAAINAAPSLPKKALREQQKIRSVSLANLGGGMMSGGTETPTAAQRDMIDRGTLFRSGH